MATKNRISRRDFVKTGAVAGAAAAAGGLASPAAAQRRRFPHAGTARPMSSSSVRARPACRPPSSRAKRVFGHHRRSRNGYRRPRDLQRRQHPARRRHLHPEEGRHPGQPRSGVPRSHRLVAHRAQRLCRLPLQRPRDHPRLRRQLRADLRIPGPARRQIRQRQAGRPRRLRARQFRAAPDACRGARLARGRDRQAARSGGTRDRLQRQWSDAAAGSGGAQSRASKSCSNTA